MRQMLIFDVCVSWTKPSRMCVIVNVTCMKYNATYRMAHVPNCINSLAFYSCFLPDERQYQFMLMIHLNNNNNPILFSIFKLAAHSMSQIICPPLNFSNKHVKMFLLLFLFLFQWEVRQNNHLRRIRMTD